jgi:hypothetical protein
MRRYSTIVGLIFVATFFAMLPMHASQRADFEILAKILVSGNDAVFFGNSVIRTPSKCDADRKSIVEMLPLVNRKNVVDASRGGMKLGTMLDLIETATAVNSRQRLVILPLNAYDGYYQDAITKSNFKSYVTLNFPPSEPNPEYARAASAPKYLDGRYFGDYKDFAKREFLTEKSAAKCPETIGFDIAFVRFMYRRNFIVDTPTAQNLSLFRDRVEKLEGRGVKVLILLMPMNIEDIELLHGTSAIEKLRKDAGRVRRELAELQVLDLSFSVAASGFADRWCACGHLNQHGRDLVAGRVADAPIVKSMVDLQQQ